MKWAFLIEKIAPFPLSFSLTSLTKQALVKGILLCSNDGQRHVLWGDNCETEKSLWRSLKIFFFRTTRQISTKLDICEWRGFKFIRVNYYTLFQRETIEKYQKYIDKFTKLNRCRPNLAHSILGKKETQVYLNDWPRPSPSKDINEIANIQLLNKKSSSPEPIDQFQPKLVQRTPVWRGFKFLKIRNIQI